MYEGVEDVNSLSPHAIYLFVLYMNFASGMYFNFIVPHENTTIHNVGLLVCLSVYFPDCLLVCLSYCCY